MKPLDTPLLFLPNKTLDALVDWLHDEVIVKQRAPGLIVGLSGTDSLVAFCAAAKALTKAGKQHRLMGVHFAPSEDFLYDHPEAEEHTWFQKQVVPWLDEQFPDAQIITDTSIDWRCDGLRWGYLMDLSVVSNDKHRSMREHEEQYWVVGTRNRKEDMLLEYSNASMAASLQPLIHLWKSDVLELSKYLEIPQIAITKSCETDCICGRMRLPSTHIREVDLLLMGQCGELAESYIQANIQPDIRRQLWKFIDTQIGKGQFKKNIPYTPDPFVFAFESGSLNLSNFNHFGHFHIAFEYLKSLSFDEALERYSRFLNAILIAAGCPNKFNLEITKGYFLHLDRIMKEYPAYQDFQQLAEAIPSVLNKISA